MKHDLNSVDPLTKLGAPIRASKYGAEIQRVVELIVKRHVFEIGDHGRGITEADCRQVKPKVPALLPYLCVRIHLVDWKTGKKLVVEKFSHPVEEVQGIWLEEVRP